MKKSATKAKSQTTSTLRSGAQTPPRPEPYPNGSSYITTMEWMVVLIANPHTAYTLPAGSPITLRGEPHFSGFTQDNNPTSLENCTYEFTSQIEVNELVVRETLRVKVPHNSTSLVRNGPPPSAKAQRTDILYVTKAVPYRRKFEVVEIPVGTIIQVDVGGTLHGGVTYDTEKTYYSGDLMELATVVKDVRSSSSSRIPHAYVQLKDAETT